MSDPPSKEPLSYAPPPSDPAFGLALTAFILGLLSFPLDYALFSGLVSGLIGIILGAAAVRRGAVGAARVLAIIGIILCTLAILTGIGCGIIIFSGNI